MALDLWSRLARERFGPGEIWLDGGFVTYKAPAPHDIDAVYFPDHEEVANAALGGDGTGLQLLTVQDIIFAEPLSGGWLARLQAVGGLMDAFIGMKSAPTHATRWDQIWSSVKGPDGRIIPGARKGYVVVRLP